MERRREFYRCPYRPTNTPNENQRVRSPPHHGRRLPGASPGSGRPDTGSNRPSLGHQGAAEAVARAVAEDHPRTRWSHYQQSTFSGFALLGSATGAAFSQALDSPTEWGQGAEGYGRRVASSYGATIINGTIQFGTSALFHEDNRYFRSTATSFGGRFGAVVISPFVARNDQGGKRFSVSSFLGGAGQSTIPLAWSPRSWQGGSEIGINALIWYGQAAGVNLVREFYPSIAAKFRKKGAAQAGGGAKK